MNKDNQVIIKSVLVTGATGFTGSHALEYLNGVEGLEVVAGCRDRSKLIPSFTGEVREGDLRDPVYLDKVTDGVDAICHCAAWSSLWGHQYETKELYLKPTIKLIDKVVEKNLKRFVSISTTSAAAPKNSSDAMSKGIPRKLWPHLGTVVAVEDYMRASSNRNTAMINLRFGIFAGSRYGLGVLPILLPRLKTHLVPWVAGGKTSLPITDGRDIGQALGKAVLTPGLNGYKSFNIVGPDVPTTREVIELIHDEYGYPKPHFSVPFSIAYPFAWLMEKIDPLVPWEPLVTRSIVHLLEEVNVNNNEAEKELGYKPKHHWKDAIRTQIDEMKKAAEPPMSMARPIM